MKSFIVPGDGVEEFLYVGFLICWFHGIFYISFGGLIPNRCSAFSRTVAVAWVSCSRAFLISSFVSLRTGQSR